MSADRLIPTSLSTPPVTGPDFMDAVQEELAGLWNAAALPLSGVAGTANAVTAAVTPGLTGSIVAGMAFWLTPVATNTGAMTLSIGATSAMPLNSDAGAALGPGGVVAGRTYLIVATATEYRLLGSSNIQKVTNFQKFTANGTWSKPAGCPDDALVVIEGVGPGGGGGSGTSGAGAGGGTFRRRIMRAGDLPATVPVTVPAGGAVDTAGGTASFGAYLLAYGGGRGANATGAGATNGGGAGGGGFGPGANGASAASAAAIGGGPDAGNGGWGTAINGTDGTDGGAGGGWGTANTSTAAGNGGRSYRGGGGGGGGSATGADGTGGASQEAGAGGNYGAAGSAPGGGGGGNAPGGRGEIRVWTIG